MKRLTDEDLKHLVIAIERQAELEGMSLDLHKRMYALSLRLLVHFMGEQCVLRNIVEKHGGPDPFRASAESTERYKNSVRVLTFVEMLFNFQDVEGFPRWCKDLRTRHDVEACLAEIQGATLLHASGFKVRFRNTKGHDLDILLPSGDVAAEIKRNLENTQMSEKTIYGTLVHARRQLPEDRAGFVFLNIPDNWLSNSDTKDRLTEVLKRLFRNTKRVTTVFL